MIQKSIFLHCGTVEACKLFTERVSEWWPKTHRLTKDAESELWMEPNGRFWERARDGREAELGRVLTWEPPHRLALDFYMGTNARQPTALEVTFTAVEGGTRVSVVHGPKPESADLWNSRAPVFERSWEAVLAAMANR